MEDNRQKVWLAIRGVFGARRSILRFEETISGLIISTNDPVRDQGRIVLDFDTDGQCRTIEISGDFFTRFETEIRNKVTEINEEKVATRG